MNRCFGFLPPGLLANSGLNIVLDISGYKSKTIDELPVQEFDWVITLCGHANETCPYFPGKKIHKGVDDPPKLAEGARNEEEAFAHYRRVRDKIRDFILTLPQSFDEKIPNADH